MQTKPALSPTLSIIVPAFNAAGFIEDCLGAILAQMGPRHELLVIDDGSRDATPALVEALAARHPDCLVKLVRQPNGGVSVARNRGLFEARGDYIVFVDADDVLLPGMLAALDAVALEHHPDVIACDFNAWRPDKGNARRLVTLGYPPNAVTRERDAVLQDFFADRHTYVWANVFRREIYLRQPQPLFPPGRVYEDVSTLSRLLADCATLYHLARPIIDYRQHAASITKAVSPSWCVDFATALLDVRRGLESRDISDQVRMLVDVMACYFYIGIVKNSFQLSWSEGQAARARVKAIFLESLFHPAEQVLGAMENGTILTRDARGDAATARQVRKALAGSVMFSVMKTVSRRLKRRKD
jgi:glycosyltransferase involved in cell wall biosynthesis